MNPESLINTVSELMEYARSIGLTRVHLCFWQGKLQICDPAHTTKRHTVFIVLDRRHLSSGLSSDEWNHLKAKLIHFFKERDLCPKPPKP